MRYYITFYNECDDRFEIKGELQVGDIAHYYGSECEYEAKVTYRHYNCVTDEFTFCTDKDDPYKT